MNRPTVGILGTGSMGEIFAHGLLRAGWSSQDLTLAVRRPERAIDVEHATGAAAAAFYENWVSWSVATLQSTV